MPGDFRPGDNQVFALRRTAIAAAFAALAFLFVAGEARANTLVRLNADHIAFYYDQYLIEADGNVRVVTSDGFEVDGQAFSMDLKLNRFLIAGHVTLKVRGQSVTGAAVSDFLDFHRIYFVPITVEPDRWTFLNGDLNHPVKGRIMPGDVFNFPNLPPHPSMTAKSAVVDERTFVRLMGVSTFGGGGLPLPSYVINFSPNPYFAQNSLTGATADLTWNFAGNAHSLSALHVRYDPQNKGPYLGFEQHLVGDHEYAVFSVSPFTKAGKYWNLMLGDRLGSRFQIQTFSQMYTYQYGLKEPGAATQWTVANATYAMPHSYFTLSSAFTNYNLLSWGAYFTPFGKGGNVGSMAHPSSAQLTWTSFQNRVGKSPIYVQTYASYGFNHDTVGDQYLYQYPGTPSGLQEYQYPSVCKGQYNNPPCFGTVYTTIYNQILGITASAQSIRLGDPDHPYEDYYFNASYNRQIQWNSLPHHITSTTESASLSRNFTRVLNGYLNYQIQNTGDYYLHGGYANSQPSYSSFAAFQGVATWHTASIGLNYVPSPEFNLTAVFRKHNDFPTPYPGLFPPPPTNVFGQYIYGTYLGQPPYDITPDLRMRLMPHLMVDVSNTYYFNYYGQKWQPTTAIQFLPI